MVLSLGFIGFFLAVVSAFGYGLWRAVTGKENMNHDAVFLLTMAPIGGFLLGCIVGNTIGIFGVIAGSIICAVATMVIVAIVVQNLKKHKGAYGYSIGAYSDALTPNKRPM